MAVKLLRTVSSNTRKQVRGQDGSSEAETRMTAHRRDEYTHSFKWTSGRNQDGIRRSLKSQKNQLESCEI